MVPEMLTRCEHALPGYLPPHKRDKRRADGYLKTLETRAKEKAALEAQLEANRLKRAEFWKQNGYTWLLRLDRYATWKEKHSARSEEHTSELQSPLKIVCGLL